MLSISNDVFTVADLIGRRPENQRFNGKSRQFLAGRCLLDAVEYLRVDPKFPATFRQLVNAHAMRVVLQCLATLEREDLKLRFRPQIEPTCVQLMQSRNQQPPYFGDDFWDWAYTIEALRAVKVAYPDLTVELTTEVQSYHDSVVSKLSSGLTFGGKNEWFGPATAVAAYRILKLCGPYLSSAPNLPKVLEKLKQQALKRIDGDKYLRKRVVPTYHQWHYGQVVSEFPDESEWQHKQARNLKTIKPLDRAARAFALSRVIQGAIARNDSSTADGALEMVYECENLERPFSTGLVGDTVKGSINVLESVWPILGHDELNDVTIMLDGLLKLYKSANKIGLAVAVPRELDELKQAFLAAGAKVRSNANSVEVDHEKYSAVIVQGKALTAAQDVTKDLINKHDAKWLVMVGIAGFLGDTDAQGRTGRNPTLGDVVIATSIAPYEIRDKVRNGEVQNVPVPFRGIEWEIIPVHPGLFAIALQAVQRSTDLTFKAHGGLIVTGTGIKDDLEEKKKILAEYPGGLAAEEESYIFGLICGLHGRPHLVLRGLSDLVGYKKAQQGVEGGDDEPQRRAARNAAKLAVKVIDLLSDGWGAR